MPLVAQKPMTNPTMDITISGRPIKPKVNPNAKLDINEAIPPSKTIPTDIPNETSCFATHLVAARNRIVATNKITKKTPNITIRPAPSILVKSFISFSYV